MRENLPKTAFILEEGLNKGQHLGGQLYISCKGEVIVDEAFGESAPGRSMQTDDLVLWLSATKPITAVAIAQQEEQGRLGWEDNVAQFIPEFAQHGKESITIWHLLTHTGGFRSADKIPEQIGWDEVIAEICAAPLEPGWVPGRKAGYHVASSWYILAEIVHRLDGRPFERYVRENIFVPIGMCDSWIGMPAEEYVRYAARIAPMYATGVGPARPMQIWNSQQGCAICRPGTNGRGRARELGCFYESLLNPTASLLKPHTIQELVKRQRIGMFDETFRHKMDWGLGFIINSNRYGIESVPYGYGRHASAETFGHSGAQSSSAFADPVHDLIVVWVLNGMPGEHAHQQRARALNSVIYEEMGQLGVLKAD